jgi:hypothetical protein
MNAFETWDAAYVLGALPPEDVATYEKHLESCAKCRARVAELTHMPGLLAAAPIDTVPAKGPVPDAVLPRLLDTVRRKRNQRRATWLGGVVTLVACAVLILVLVLPSSTGGTPMTQVAATPMQVSVGLSTVDWGTKISVRCHYSGQAYTGASYRLSVTDRNGRTSDAGSWRAVAGEDTMMDAATAVPKDQIAELRVLTADGTPVLQTIR